VSSRFAAYYGADGAGAQVPVEDREHEPVGHGVAIWVGGLDDIVAWQQLNERKMFSNVEMAHEIHN